MAKREWGAKHTCIGCGVKFYDLHRSPIECPKCGIGVEVETVRPNRRRPPAQPEQRLQPASTKTVVETAVDETDDDTDEVIDDIDTDDDDDLVDGIDDSESTQPEP